MSGTIQYDENGAVDPALEQIRESKEAVHEAQGQDVYTEGNGEHVEDPTAMTGTLETDGTSGMQQSADTVSAVFDETNNPSGAEEGSLGVISDPAASGDTINPETGAENLGGATNSAQPDLTDNTNAGGPEGTAALQDGTTDTTGTDGDTGADAGATEPEASIGDENAFDSSKDPGDYKVAEVLAYFNAEGTRKQSIDKVKRAEADGQNRKTIVEFEKA